MMPETNDLRAAQFDLMTAVEEGCFKMETPRVDVDQSQFSALGVSASNNIERTGNHAVLNPTIDVEIELTVKPAFYTDFLDHKNGDAPMVLYGFERLWLVEKPDTSLTPTFAEDRVVLDGTIKWPKAVPNGERW